MAIPKIDRERDPLQTAINDPMRRQLALEFVQLQELIKASRRHVHHFMTMFSAASGLPIETCVERFWEMLDTAEVRLRAPRALAPEPSGEVTVPRKIHRIWLTNIDAPAEPPAEYITKLLDEMKSYSVTGWTQNLWIQDPRLIPLTVERLRTADGKIAIRRIPESGLSSGALSLFNAFVRDRKFPFAADILRMAVLYQEGGVYADLGARFVSEAYASIVRNNFDYALIFWETMFFQNSLMMMPPKSKVGQAFLEIAEDPYSLPKGMVAPLSGLREGMAFSGLLITSIILSMYDETMRICPLAPNAKLVSWSAQQSWYTDVGNKVGKHGNTYVPESEASFLQPNGWAGRGPEQVHPIFRPTKR